MSNINSLTVVNKMKTIQNICWVLWAILWWMFAKDLANFVGFFGIRGCVEFTIIVFITQFNLAALVVAFYRPDEEQLNWYLLSFTIPFALTIGFVLVVVVGLFVTIAEVVYLMLGGIIFGYVQEKWFFWQ